MLRDLFPCLNSFVIGSTVKNDIAVQAGMEVKPSFRGENLSDFFFS